MSFISRVFADLSLGGVKLVSDAHEGVKAAVT
jgi:hypothetical protein